MTSAVTKAGGFSPDSTSMRHVAASLGLQPICVVLAVLLLAACSRETGVPVTPLANDSRLVWEAMSRLPDWSGAWTKPEPLQQSIFEDCCVAGSKGVPFQPRYLAIRDAIARDIQAGRQGTDNLVRCIPDGVPGILTHGIAHEYLFSPGKVTMLFEDGEVRRIYTDGRAHPDLSELHDTVEGHSIGHWEGTVLVVDTIGMAGRAELFLNNDMHVTSQTHVVERIFLKDKDTLQIDTTISDPELFTSPYKYTIWYSRVLREPDFDVGCAQSNRDTGNSVDLTPPPEDE